VSFPVADVPGLIEDAHKNRGLGISFLKHIERCVCLLYVIDLSSPDPFAQLQTLISELEHYNPTLTQRPSIILANKMDLKEARSKLEDFKAQVGTTEVKVIPISAKHSLNLQELLSQIRTLYDEETDKLREKYLENKTKQSELDLLTWTRSSKWYF